METKGALQSKTIQGIALITAVVTAFLEYGPQIQAMIPAPWDKRLGLALALIGAAWAAYGRYTATSSIKGAVGKSSNSGHASPFALLALCVAVPAILWLSACSTVCNRENVKDGLAAANNTFAVVANATADANEAGALSAAAYEKAKQILANAYDALTTAEKWEALGMVEEACQSIETATGALGRVK